MPSHSSGRIEKVRKNKFSTPHQKNHRWESFSTKISKFNSLHPLRKVRRHDLDTEDLSTATSYFQNGLQKWGELNVSQPFSSFKREVLPLSESLPQLLHFEERIMESLVKHISMQDKEGLEPLLDLLTAFAHDLGARFEKHYPKSLDLLLAIAGKPQDVEVIEWTFGTMAFLFKYLSKLLVPNLKPTYDVLSPLLGRSRHPPYIARFAAEAMSFLVKKAAAPSHREDSLPAIVEHIRLDLQSMVDNRQFILYNDGLMTMFAEAIKGTDNTIHSTGGTIFAALMNAIPDTERTLTSDTIWTDLICGVLTSVMHHANADTFKEFSESVVEAIQKEMQAIPAKDVKWRSVPHLRILGTLAGVRKGWRISNWVGIVRQLVDVLEKTAKSVDEVQNEDHAILWKHCIFNVAVVWHYAPIDALIPHISSLIQSLTREPFMSWFIPFCSYFSELDSRRFGSLFRGELQKFIASHWSQGQNEDILCVLLPKIIGNGGFPSSGEKDCCRLPQTWQDQIVSKFERLEISPFPERGPYNKDPQVWRDRCLPQYAALLQLLELTVVHPSTNARIAELLLRKLKLALRPSSTLASDEVNFIVGQGFHAYLRMSRDAGSIDITLSPLLRAAVPRFARSVGFLHAYLAYEQALNDRDDAEKHDAFSSDSSASDEDPVTASLVENLSSPSHDIRLASLKLLRKTNDAPPSSECIDTMLQIEETPLALAHTRSIAMLLRKLSIQYGTLDGKGWLGNGIPRFMFGMLTVKLSPVWDDAVEALKQVAESKAGEESVCSMAFEWIEVPSARWTPPNPENSNSRRPFVSGFDCTAVLALRKSAAKTQEASEKADDMMLQIFDESQKLADGLTTSARSRAIKVFSMMPFIAERRSRQLVPHFLSWALDGDQVTLPVQGEGEDEPEDEGSNWSLIDRKGLLGVFSQFINPRVLYQHEKVYESLLHLMENGDVEVQKLTLKAILAWKQEGVKAYKENLEFLLDEARFKDELSVFLRGDHIIKAEHREELMPVLLRLLYGRTISKKGAASGRQGLQTTRLSVIRNLSIQDMGSFLQIATGKLRDVQVVGSAAHRNSLFDEAIIPARKQVGFVNMIWSLISELGSNVGPYMETLLNTVLYCLVYACRHLGESASDSKTGPTQDGEKASTQSLLKMTRTTGIKCLIALFQNCQDFEWLPYQDIIVEEVVAPRLANLPVETAQGVSGMLQLFSTWSVLPKAALFLGPHGDVLPEGVIPKIVACIAVEKGKDEVKVFALGILRNLAKLAVASAAESEFNEIIRTELLDPNAGAMLANITTVLTTTNTSIDLLEGCVETILAFAPILGDLDNVQAVIKIASFLLKQPPRRVSPKAKGRILLIVESFVSRPVAAQDEKLLYDVYCTLSSLFSYFKDRENRQALCRALIAISRQDADVAVVASLCDELNSFKEGRIDEPDYDRRLAAFSSISSNLEVPFTPKQWLPLLHNLTFFVRVDEEFGVLSSNSADGLRRFIQNTANCETPSVKAEFEGYLESILMTAIRGGAREPSETVRREYLRVLGFLLSAMPEWPPVADLSGLLGERHEDSSELLFFFNILSPATGRQLEALRALETANAANEMSSQNLSQFFIPLLEHFIFGKADGSDDHGLGAHAASTIGNLALSLQWSHYRTTLNRYISYVASKPESQKQTIRLMGTFADALSQSLEADSAEAMEIDESNASSPPAKRLRLTMPRDAQLAREVVDHFLPSLLKHLHEKDESEVSYRVPVGVIIVKLLRVLPTAQMDQKLAAVLTDISFILRSKASESRDMARDTLVKIAVILGPSYVGFMLKELRGALTRGYQLHVLSYTMHSILVATVPSFAPGDLDHCLSPIVIVIMDDIFGVIGQEKDAEGYITEMKEVKSSKSQDSMELLAKNASVGHLIRLVKPLQALLMQKANLKMVRKIDTLMARITSGLLQNPAAESRDTLVFCYEVIQEVYRSRKPEAVQHLDYRLRKYLIQKGASKSADRGKTMKHTYKLARFAFDILRSMFKRHDSLRTAANIDGFLAILGDAIIDGEDELKISAFRLLAVIVKVQFTSEDGSNIYKTAVKEATKSISMSTSTTTDLSQAALKMLAVVLRDRRDVVVKDAAIDMLLGKLKDDFTEPLYRHVTFNFLRSVLDRRIETATVYDTMDHVGTVMISNDDKDTRDLARGAFFQFIREYPQKKARWSKQLNFIVANLKYDREGGRLSVMEILHLLLMKSSNDFVQEMAATCFLPLFFVIANDDSEKCRQAAGELIKEIFRKSDKERTQSFLALVRAWLEKGDESAVLRLALLVFGHYFECHESSSKNKSDFRAVFAKVMSILGTENIRGVDGELVETVLGVVRVFATVLPEKTFGPDSEALWKSVANCMEHPKPVVKLSAIRLISLYLSDFAKGGVGIAAGETVEGSHGLKLDVDTVQEFARLALRVLSGFEVEETLATEAGQILIFLGPRLPVAATAMDDADIEEGNGQDDDGEIAQTQKNLQYLFWRLSHILRKEIRPKAPAITCKVVAMEVLETICRRSSKDRLEPSLKTILTPMHNLTDPSIPAPFTTDDVFKTKHEGLKTRAQILMDAMQKKFGTAEYTKQLLAIREEVRARRLERSSKRKIEALAHPEKYGRDKRKKFEKNKDRMKSRSKEQKSMRQAYKGW